MSAEPSVFISYSWDSDAHKGWVRALAERLVSNGVRVKLDQWDLVPGDSLTQFMESEITACDFVIVVCTPSYAMKSTDRTGGVGYEQQIITGNLASGIERRKFIPIVRDGEMSAGPQLAIPPHFQGILAIDMRGPAGLEHQIEGLLRAVFRVPALSAPPLGKRPRFAQDASESSASQKPSRPARLAVMEFDGWHLVSGVAMNERYPDTFSIPSAESRGAVMPGDFVKLGFEVAAEDPDEEGGVTTLSERMWIKLVGSYGPYLWGTLHNQPTFDGEEIELTFGSEVVFLPEHIIDIMHPEDETGASASDTIQS